MQLENSSGDSDGLGFQAFGEFGYTLDLGGKIAPSFRVGYLYYKLDLEDNIEYNTNLAYGKLAFIF